MKAIFKYKISFEDINNISMPKGSEVLTVQIDEKTNSPCIWALVDTDVQETVVRLFALYGTGHPLMEHSDQKYIGTFQYQNGDFVGHIFELTELKF